MKRSDLDIALELIPTDRIFQRWARSVGNGMAEAEWDGTESRATELPHDAAVWVDRYVCTRPKRMKQFIHAWYRGQDLPEEMAKRFNVTHRGLYGVWRDYLVAAREDFLAERCLRRFMIRSELARAA